MMVSIREMETDTRRQYHLRCQQKGTTTTTTRVAARTTTTTMVMSARNRQCIGVSALIVMAVIACGSSPVILGFQQQQLHRQHQTSRARQQSTARRLVPESIDPNDVSVLVSTITDHSSSIVDQTQHVQRLVLDSSSTFISSTLQAVKAHGHSNLLFGPPDPHLKEVPCNGVFWQLRGVHMCPKSIEPTARALTGVQEQIDQHKANFPNLSPQQLTHVTVRSQEAAQAATEIVKEKALKLGMKPPSTPLRPIEFDVKTITPDMMVQSNTLPGFAETKSLLAPHTDLAIPGVPSTAVEAMRFNGGLMYGQQLWAVLDKIPYVIFWYAVVEFFYLRPNSKDLYKEDIEDDPVGVTTEVASDAAVRVGIFFVLTVLTLTFTETLKV